ncbi:S-layer homology domain-containing protein [Paenibacillus sp. HWE-109]|uniref:S-layer homology domain-containing protein n=1 Tax=Paenibacillus sp. HWE-109 TaxID=1306526 RepID=UPI001EDD4949|nr:S-layer homology domain-containing protein [Paenibacillus sp. HWE-109]UKS24123.1 S-layer homology domain-containing protein [Paenibacillus sp. HWE-109]
MMRKSGLFFILCMLLLTSFPIGTALGAVTTSFTPVINASQVAIGDKVFITIKGQQVTDLYGYEVTLTYDADRLEFNQGQSNGAFAGYKIIKNAGNQIIFAYTKVGNMVGENGDLSICTFAFKAKQSGQANVTLQQVTTVTSQSQPMVWQVNEQVSVKIGSDGSPGPATNPGGGIGVPTTPPAQEDSNHYVPKEVELRIETAQDGRSSVTAVIESKQLTQKLLHLQTTIEGHVLYIEIPGEYAWNAVQLPLHILYDSMKANKGIVLKIRSHLGSYDLPLSILDREDVASALNDEGATLIVRIDKAGIQDEERLRQSVVEKGLQLVSNVINYEVILKSKDKEEEIHNFGNRFVTRVLTVNDVIQNPTAATAVVYDPITGEMRSVPSVFNVKNGKTEVNVIRNTNSMYAIVQNKKTFEDMSGHWAKEDLESLAAKMIINGITDRTYLPDLQVTRAQFAAMLVRALGLEVATASQLFTDVAATEWYAPEVATAAKYGLVQGVGENKFNPDRPITREQMVVMIMNAVKLVKGTTSTEVSNYMMPFSDQNQFSDYARSAVAEAAKDGWVHGKTETTFAPQEAATRAEAAVLIKQAMQHMKLLN